MHVRTQLLACRRKRHMTNSSMRRLTGSPAGTANGAQSPLRCCATIKVRLPDNQDEKVVAGLVS